jgi:ATP-dependent Clp protease ATP-binding subunit ClpA
VSIKLMVALQTNLYTHVPSWAFGADLAVYPTTSHLITTCPQGGLQDGESALDRFTTDLTQSARIGKLDPVIGEWGQEMGGAIAGGR